MVDDEGADRSEIARLLGRFLAAVSFPEGARPSYDDLHDLFVDGAKLIKNTAAAPEIASLDEFIAARVEMVDEGRLTSFEEVEVAAVTEVFGNVAHRFSSYEKRGTTDGAPIDARGAISTQLVRTAQGWRISSMAWDDERPGLELPGRYLQTTQSARTLVGWPDPMTVALVPDEPLTVVSGDPHASIVELYRDGVVEAGVWEVTPGEFGWENAGFAEQMYVLSGDATATSDDDATVELRAGVVLTTGSGWRGSWNVRETVRKIYVIWQTP